MGKLGMWQTLWEAAIIVLYRARAVREAQFDASRPDEGLVDRCECSIDNSVNDQIQGHQSLLAVRTPSHLYFARIVYYGRAVILFKALNFSACPLALYIPTLLYV